MKIVAPRKEDFRVRLLWLSAEVADMCALLSLDVTSRKTEMSTRTFRSLEEYKNDIVRDVLYLRKLTNPSLAFSFTRYLDLQKEVETCRKNIAVLARFAANAKDPEDKKLLQESVSMCTEALTARIRLYNTKAILEGWATLV